MRRRYPVIVILVLFFGLVGNLVLQTGPSRYLVINETFGLAQAPENGSHQIIAFIPRYYLLFINDRRETTTIPGSPHTYLAATTQDGVKVLVNASDVSRVTFEDVIGHHQYIFNDRCEIFRDEACDSTTSDVWTVGPGEAFFTQSAPAEYVVKLEGTRPGATIVGFLERSKLEELEKNGRVTRADRSHPKYSIERREIVTFGTSPGQQWHEGDRIPLPRQHDLERLVLERCQIGIIEGAEEAPDARLTVNYGAPARQISFFAYEITDNAAGPGQDRTFTYIIEVEYECTTDLLLNKPFRINKVEAHGPQGASWVLAYEEFKTPDNLKSLLRSPYLFSINNYAHYFKLIERLSDRIGDRTLAGYFLCEFNRSLPSYRRGKFDYSY